MENFEEIFNQFKALRMESIRNLVIYNPKEYKRLIQESDRLFMELCEYVKPEGMALFLDYCIVITLLQGTAESVMYEQGFRDGFSLIKLMFNSNNT